MWFNGFKKGQPALFRIIQCLGDCDRTELFPFIYDASERMSARAISRFFQEEQNIKLSAVTITNPRVAVNSAAFE